MACLPHVECQHLLSFEVSLYVLSYLQGAYAYGCAGEDEVARLEHEELAHVAHQFVNAEEHVCRVTLLHGVSVDVESEAYVLHVGKALYGYEFAQYGRTVKTLTELPRQSFAAESLLHVACSDVYAHGYGIVVSVSKARSDVLAQLADAHHQFALVVEPLGKVGDKEGLSPLEQRAVGFHEYYGTFGFGGLLVEFFEVFGIVYAHAYNLHVRCRIMVFRCKNSENRGIYVPLHAYIA